MKTKIFIILTSIIMASCGSMRPHNASNYQQDLITPEETNNFVLTESSIFDEPMLGIALKYDNKQYPTDIINVYVYPIDSISWEDTEEIISVEMKDILTEIDLAIEQGHYKSRSKETLENFSFKAGEKSYTGKKSSFTFTSMNDTEYFSNSYVFIEKDKYIKFRTSFDSRATVKWNGDTAVKEILPGITVPDESEYMKSLRAEHQREITQNLMKLLLQTSKDSQSGAE
ncbi:hypothetical protein BTJ40_09135 [Microbulbifer sp. A4B17]|uniref:hypothetical protein n=1 Tax=Microbulbifer sp. A4B17 TaxID=359370 RepID=UPI000D52D284|nr:hypothetical protein [Microbulbifer sp. A4B17]AWF80960.1 hypothetical protein BTJ40_09135 [Microbulbifer sp. A4B17]